MRPTMIRATLAAVLLTAACTDRETACRLTVVAGPIKVMEGFARGEGITTAPAVVPSTLVARFLGGPAVMATVARDTVTGGLVLVVPPPDDDTPPPGYGVLVTDRTLAPLGLLLYDGAVLPGHTEIGRVEVGGFVLPLLGVRVAPEAVEDSRCPLFPADVAR